MLKKEIVIQETNGVARVNEFVRTGIPFARGELSKLESLVILSTDGGYQYVQTTVLSYWHDGSVKWLLLDFSCSVSPHGKVSYYLTEQPHSHTQSATDIRVVQSKINWTVDTGPCQFILDAKKFYPFVAIQVAGKKLLSHGLHSACILRDEHGLILDPVVDEIVKEDTSGPIRTILRLCGFFGKAGCDSIRFSCRLHFFGGTSLVLLEMCLHNPKAAHHPGGLWDLGDPGSFLLKEFSLRLPLARELVCNASCQPYQDSRTVRSDAKECLSIYQESSGGEQWRSPVHRNRTGEVPLTFRGYEVQHGGEKIANGERATPVMWCGRNDSVGVAAVLPNFWQEFPKALAWDGEGLKISLFPAEFPDLHELQGGEQKNHTLYLDFAATPESLNWARRPLAAVASPHVFHDAGVFQDLPFFPATSEVEIDLADALIDGPEEFFHKREIIDEYGWRNFGEVYADHEAAFHQGPEIFVSHYNNQYDLCAGFYRKFMATSDPRWGELAMDLARHVLDIDIYHTSLDREEYTHGLFWHTDHYIDAGLATHRSFSREHLKKKNPLFCGGGPGAEHCYSNGLTIHYFLTGNPQFREAVIELANWVVLSLKGPQTILASLKRGIGYLNLWRNNKGARKLFPRYPLTRGTGNAISTCLDAFQVEGNPKFLNLCEELIAGAIHPHDDISARNLLNAETAWSYTVFLLALVKFLDKKIELGEFRDCGSHAKESLLAYAEWMLQNEYPYLEKPDILEYPNETWAAQDLRKAVVFYHASRYAKPDKHQDFTIKTRYFFEYGRDELFRQPTSRFSRPFALILQNGWVENKLWVNPNAVSLPEDGKISEKPTPSLKLLTVATRIVEELQEIVRITNISKEWDWIRFRIGINS